MSSSLPIRALIYDCGNTLLKPRPTVAELCDMVAAQHGHRIDPDEFERALPYWGQMYYERLQRGMYETDASVRAGWAEHYAGTLAKLLDLAPDEAALVGGAIYDWYAHPERWELYDDVMATLDEGKRRGYVQGVLSDWGSDLLPILSAHELTRHFDFVVVSAVVGHAKPGGEIFRQAVRRAGVIPAEALYVGDSYIADVLGARSAGLHVALLDREGTAPAVDCPVVRTLGELFPLADALSGRQPAAIAAD